MARVWTGAAEACQGNWEYQPCLAALLRHKHNKACCLLQGVRLSPQQTECHNKFEFLMGIRWTEGQHCQLWLGEYTDMNWGGPLWHHAHPWGHQVGSKGLPGIHPVYLVLGIWPRDVLKPPEEADCVHELSGAKPWSLTSTLRNWALRSWQGQRPPWYSTS